MSESESQKTIQVPSKQKVQLEVNSGHGADFVEDIGDQLLGQFRKIQEEVRIELKKDLKQEVLEELREELKQLVYEQIQKNTKEEHTKNKYLTTDFLNYSQSGNLAQKSRTKKASAEMKREKGSPLRQSLEVEKRKEKSQGYDKMRKSADAGKSKSKEKSLERKTKLNSIAIIFEKNQGEETDKNQTLGAEGASRVAMTNPNSARYRNNTLSSGNKTRFSATKGSK